jgi:uncharacterized membrane protein YobD (UPF0266 family)
MNRDMSEWQIRYARINEEDLDEDDILDIEAEEETRRSTNYD